MISYIILCVHILDYHQSGFSNLTGIILSENLNFELFVNIINVRNMCQPWLFIPYFYILPWWVACLLLLNASNHTLLNGKYEQNCSTMVKSFTWYVLDRLNIHHEGLSKRSNAFQMTANLPCCFFFREIMTCKIST